MTYGEILPIWWSMVWRNLIAAPIVGFIIGFVVGFLGGVLGYPDLGMLWGLIAGAPIGILVSLWAVRAAINKHGLRPPHRHPIKY